MSLKTKASWGTSILFLCVLCALNVIRSSAQAQEQESSSGAPAEVIATIDEFAKELAALLEHPGTRNQLRVAIEKSAKREHIVFLDELLASFEEGPALPEKARGKAKGLLEKANGAKSRFSKIAALVSPEIDVYFPVKDHKAMWKGSDDLLVAVGTLEDEAKQIKVYSVKTQQAKFIDGGDPPAEPVIVVAPCEHESHEAQPILKDVDIPEVEPAPEPPGEHSWKVTNYFKITTTSEGWLMGDPEIYVWVVQARTNRTLMPAKKYLPGVNDPGRWKNLAGCPTALGFYWDSTYDRITYYKVMEEDSGTIINTPVTVAYGSFSLSFTLKIRNGDDNMGSVNVDRNSVGWCPYGPIGSCCSCYTRYYSTGKAAMRMTLAR